MDQEQRLSLTMLLVVDVQSIGLYVKAVLAFSVLLCCNRDLLLADGFERRIVKGLCL